MSYALDRIKVALQRTTPTTPTYEVFLDAGNGWRYRERAANGKILMTSGEAYASKSNAKRAAYREAAQEGAKVKVLPNE